VLLAPLYSEFKEGFWRFFFLLILPAFASHDFVESGLTAGSDTVLSTTVAHGFELDTAFYVCPAVVVVCAPERRGCANDK